ncbi:MAG: hypothetical protein CSA66_06840 [Proteobacteria bacterium]|nr:MAG: hypothetical protein CSA66_06840 [Pseudomonadota bacterium]
MSNPPQGRIFDASYREVVTLADGTEVLLRLLRPDDKGRILDGLERMSPESRYRRFFAVRDSLSERELAYLTEIDQETHFALAAGRRDLEARGDVHAGLGVGRFICDRDAPSRAEVAVAVVDDMHGQGLGRILFKRVVAAAAERGVETIHVSVLGTNDAMLGLLRSVFDEYTLRVEEGVVIVECPLPHVALDQPEQRPEGAVYRVLAMAGGGLLRVVRGARTWPVPSDLAAGLLEGEGEDGTPTTAPDPSA